MNKLSQEVRDMIINAMYNMQIHGAFDGFGEENMRFEKSDEEDLIYYRDEWIVKADEFDDEDYLEGIQAYYDEDVYEYWKIDKERIQNE